MSRAKSLTMLSSTLALVVCVSACQQKEAEATAGQQGPAEIAGKHIDQAAVKAGEQLNKVAEEAGKGLAKAGEKLQNAAQEAQKKE
jgi:hypothetical protein